MDWLIDGVPDTQHEYRRQCGPAVSTRKDIDYLEVQRGSYDADYGDRTYGIFNVVPRTGFERNNEANSSPPSEISIRPTTKSVLAATPQRFAYYASLNGNRSDYGLQTPDWARLFTTRKMALEDSLRSYSILIPRTNFAWSRRFGRTITRFPYDPDPNSLGNQAIMPRPSTAFATVNASPTVT